MHSAIAHHWQLMPNQFLSKQLHPQLTPPILLLGMTSHGIECSFGQSGSSFLVLSLHRCLCTASLLTGSSVWESEKSLILCKHCSAITTTLVCKQHCRFFFFFLYPKYGIIPATMKTIISAETRKLGKDRKGWNTAGAGNALWGKLRKYGPNRRETRQSYSQVLCPPFTQALTLWVILSRILMGG